MVTVPAPRRSPDRRVLLVPCPQDVAVAVRLAHESGWRLVGAVAVSDGVEVVFSR